jgi:phosphatidylglycerol:prolipoprotein diacylglycerol transferase
LAITFPNIDPVLVNLGIIQIRYYALAYILGLLLGWWYLIKLNENQNLWQKIPNILDRKKIEDLFSYIAFGVIFGGRLGYVIFYKPSHYLENPINIFKVWEGGMAFHGGVLGVIIAIFLFARKYKINAISVADCVVTTVPIGLFFGRIANFINAELYGRVTDVAWAVRFPLHSFNRDMYGDILYTDPRHPSQLYEAFFEGIVLFIILRIATHFMNSLNYTGLTTGLFLVFYALARSFCELYREPDNFLGFIIPIGDGGLTQGIILSIPMLLLGLYFIIKSKKNTQSLT